MGKDVSLANGADHATFPFSQKAMAQTPHFNGEMDDLADSGMRVLGVAFRPVAGLPAASDDAAVESDLIFVGMAGMIDLIRQGFFDGQDTLVFIHTGGSAALFAYWDRLRTDG